MQFTFHKEATANFNLKAEKLLELIRPTVRVSQRNGRAFPSQIPSKVIKQEDLVEESFAVTECDYRGEPISRYFAHMGTRIGLDEAAYAELKKLGSSIHKISMCRDLVSHRFIEDVIFSWIRQKYCKPDFPHSFIQYLISKLDEKVVKGEYWVPIAFFEIEKPFRFANSEIRPITEKQISEWMKNKDGDALSEGQTKILSEIRKNYQGLAAVVTRIEGEEEYSRAQAIVKAERVTSALAVFSGRVLVPDLKCVSRIKGSECVSQARVFSVVEGNFMISDIVVDGTSMRYWRLSAREVDQLFFVGLGKLSDLMESKFLSPFSKSVLNAIDLYSKVAFTQDPIEKIVYALSAIESILLQNQNEGISQNISERMAFALSDELPERKAIKTRVREAYSIRSKYLHHGLSDKDYRLTTDFLRDVWLFILGLLDIVAKFNSKDEFLSMLEDKKLS